MGNMLLRPQPLPRLLHAYRTATYRYIRPWTLATFVTSVKCLRSRGALPLLRAERSDRTLEDIPEEDLYRYTRNRWMHLSKRYLKFDLQQLLKAAVAAVSKEGARYCTKVVKCREGLNNKAYLLTMDNGSEVFAKLPSPVAGPAFFTTASEVATREFLRDAMNIPTPRVVAWSADRNNPVGAEYILEEKAPGEPLGSHWYQWPLKSKLEIISQIVEMERQLALMKFTKSGCIYFRKDVPDSMGSDNAIMTNVPVDSSILERFRLGPLVSSGLWRGKRADNEPLEFVEAMATNEMQYIKKFGRPRMNYHQSSTKPELAEEVLDLLHRYLQLAPAMVPPLETEDTHSPTLWHPDLHLDNVFVDPKSKQITRIIDWQSASVMPFFYQCGIARMLQHPGTVADGWAFSELPENYGSVDEDEKAKIDSDRNSEICLKYYQAETMIENPRHWAALQLEHTNVRTEPSRLAVNVWEDRDVFFLRRALISIVEQWQDLCPGPDTSPVTFSEQELALHAAEEERMSHIGELLGLLQDKWGLPPNGMVDPNEFDSIRTAVAELRDSFIECGDDEAEKELFAKLWPYQEVDG